MNQKQLTQLELATNATTWEHINLVMKLLASAQIELMRRQFTHDRSKLLQPEVAMFAEMTPRLAGLTYGSEEYKQCLQEMLGAALKHHYKHNRHHPEFFEKCDVGSEIKEYMEAVECAEETDRSLSEIDAFPSECLGAYDPLLRFLEQKQKEEESSINKMNLFDLLEMICDWYAATKRHNDGDISKSIEINTERFSLSPQLVQILKNTVPWIEDEFAQFKTQFDIGYIRGNERTHISGVSLDDLA